MIASRAISKPVATSRIRSTEKGCCRRKDFTKLWKRDLPFGTTPRYIQNDEGRRAVRNGRKDDLISGEIPGARGANRLQAFETRRRGRRGQLAGDGARPGVGEK